MPEEEKKTELERLTELRDDYEKIECNGISVKWDKGKGILIIKLYDDGDEKTYYLPLDRRKLTDEQRIGLRAISNMTENVLWESGGSDDGPPMYV